MDEKSLARALDGLPLGPVRYFDRTGSTNDQAASWAEAGAPDLSLVVADEQTAGRGRLARRWFTPPGAALAFSLVLRPKRRATGEPLFNPALLTALPALGVSEALRQAHHLPAEIKWPNDVLVNGRKVAGILVEAAWQGDQLGAVILGTGVNVSRGAVPPGVELLFPATSLEEELGQPVEREALLRNILAQILAWRPQIDTPAFIQAWEARLAFRGEWVRISPALEPAPGASPDPYPEGQISGLGPDGALQLRLRDGSVLSVSFGDVHLRPLKQNDPE